MGKARFLYNNLISDGSMITVSSLRSGVVTGAKKSGLGSATLVPSGAYSGTVDKKYILEIDSVTAGQEIGQATFRWSNGGGIWNAVGVATSAVNILLENGVYVKWVAGTGDDFELGDEWTMIGMNMYNANAMIDRDRDHRCRTAALESPNTFTIDLTSVTTPTFDSLAIYDHNFTAAATIIFEADDAATFDSGAGGSPQVSEAVTWADSKILHYLAASHTKDYARLKVTDAANPAGYLEIGELCLGAYLELSRYFSEGYTRDIESVMESNVTRRGVGKDRFYNWRYVFGLDFRRLPAADITSMETMLSAIGDRDTGILLPVWLNLDSAVPANTWLVKITKLPVRHRTGAYYDSAMKMAEVLASV